VLEALDMAEIISITTGRPIGEATTNVIPFTTAEPDPMALLSGLAGRALASGADPSAVVGADDELLLLCDQIVTIKRQSYAMADHARALGTQSRALHDPAVKLAWAEHARLDRSARSPILRATKLHATTPAGIFAKAVAIRSCSDQAAVLAKSMANDLLNSPELRKVLWPAAPEVPG
jgi:hypothetical protein